MALRTAKPRPPATTPSAFAASAVRITRSEGFSISTSTTSPAGTTDAKRTTNVFRAEMWCGTSVASSILLAGTTLEVTSYSGGVNWWLTRNVRFSADVVREDYHGKINFGALGGRHGALLGILARFQIDF